MAPGKATTVRRAPSFLADALARRTYRWSLALVRQRGDLPYLLNERRLLGCAAEIGVSRGKFSSRMLARWQGAHLLSIDPWTTAPADEYVDLENVAQDEQDARYEEVRSNLARYGGRSSVWRMTSAQAAERVPPRSLDFVYIDARHDYESMREDLKLWYPRVRPHGILAGHDYLDGNLPQGVFEVKRAVDEFCRQRGLRLHVTRDGEWPSWVLEVPQLPVPRKLSSGVPAEDPST